MKKLSAGTAVTSYGGGELQQLKGKMATNTQDYQKQITLDKCINTQEKKDVGVYKEAQVGSEG